MCRNHGIMLSSVKTLVGLAAPNISKSTAACHQVALNRMMKSRAAGERWLSLGRRSTRDDDLSEKIQNKLLPEAPCGNLTATPLHKANLAPPRARRCDATRCATQTALRNASVHAFRAIGEPERNGQDVHRATEQLLLQ